MVTLTILSHCASGNWEEGGDTKGGASKSAGGGKVCATFSAYYFNEKPPGGTGGYPRDEKKNNKPVGELLDLSVWLNMYSLKSVSPFAKSPGYYNPGVKGNDLGLKKTTTKWSGEQWKLPHVKSRRNGRKEKKRGDHGIVRGARAGVGGTVWHGARRENGQRNTRRTVLSSRKRGTNKMGGALVGGGEKLARSKRIRSNPDILPCSSDSTKRLHRKETPICRCRRGKKTKGGGHWSRMGPSSGDPVKEVGVVGKRWGRSSYRRLCRGAPQRLKQHD